MQISQDILESKISEETRKEMLTSVGWSYSFLSDVSGGYWYKDKLTACTIKEAWEKEMVN